MNLSITKEFAERFGIVNLEDWILEYKRFEEYVQQNYSDICDEAWSNYVNSDEGQS